MVDIQYDEERHIGIAKSCLEYGYEIPCLCSKLGISQKKLFELGDNHPEFGFIVQKIREYSYIKPDKEFYYVEVAWNSKFDPSTHPKKMIDCFRRGYTISQVCGELKIGRGTYNKWRGTFPLFNEAHEYGMTLFQAYWEKVMGDGIKGEIENFGGQTLAFMFRNVFKDEYADVKNINATTTTYNALSNSELVARTLGKIDELKKLQGDRQQIEHKKDETIDGSFTTVTENIGVNRDG